MKKIIIESIKLLCIFSLTLFFVGCEEEVKEYPGDVGIISNGFIYKNDGPLASVTSICGVLCFDDEAHFESTYQYLEERYETNQDQDSTASLDAFQTNFSYTSRRNFVDDWETDMEDQGISIDASNDIDTLHFGDDVMQTLLSENCIAKIGEDAVLILDECAWVRTPFNDCEGVALLKQFVDRLSEEGEAANEAATEFLFQNNIEIDNSCSSLRGKPECGFTLSFSYQDPVLFQGAGYYEILLTDETIDTHSKSKWRRWKLKDNDPFNPARFIPFSGAASLSAFGEDVKLRVPWHMDKITVVLSKRTSLFGCKDEMEKTIYLKCPHPDWTYIDNDNIQFYTRNPIPGMQVLWGFGDVSNTTSTLLDPQFDYNLACRKDIFYTFNIISPSGECSFDYLSKIGVGPENFLDRRETSDWHVVGEEKFKFRLVFNGSPRFGISKVKAFIKYKKRNKWGLWFGKKTNLKIQLQGNIYHKTTCALLNDLSVVSSTKTKNNKRRMTHKYKTSTPIKLDTTDPIKAYFEAGGISRTFDIMH